MIEKRIVEDPAYKGIERRHTGIYCDKLCSNHKDVKIGLKEMHEFKDEQISKMSKCITALGILFIVFTSSMVIASSSFLKSTKVTEAQASIVEKVDTHIEQYREEQSRFAEVVTKVEVLDTKLDNVQYDIAEIKEILKKRL